MAHLQITVSKRPSIFGDVPLSANLDIFIKFPFGPFANGSLMLRHHFPTAKTTVVAEVTNKQLLAERMFELFSTSHSSTASVTPHPLIPLALFVDHLRCLNEDERMDIDKSICHLESRSGVTLHTFGSRSRARISEFALLKKELHMKEALMAMADHVFSFQTKMIAFAAQESHNFSQLLPVDSSGLKTGSLHRRIDFVNASLDLNGSMATWTLEQLQALRKRLRVQAKVVSQSCFYAMFQCASGLIPAIRLMALSQQQTH